MEQEGTALQMPSAEQFADQVDDQQFEDAEDESMGE